MDMLDSRTLAAIRKEKLKWLTDVCTIEARAGLDEYGGEGNDWQIVVADVKCRVIRNRKLASRSETDYGSQATVVDEYRLIVPFGTSFDLGQRVTLASGDVYYITGVVDKLTDQTDAQALMVRERG